MQQVEPTLQSAFAQAVNRFSCKIAIEYKAQKMTFQELDRITDCIASSILKQGTKQGTHIAILQADRIHVICSILGILKAGCVFVPINMEYPVERMKTMLDTADVEVVLMDNGIPSEQWNRLSAEANLKTCINLDEIQTETVDESWKMNGIEYHPTDGIYVYFSSGTTGKPKAILGQNKSLLYFVNWEMETFAVSEQSRVSQLTSPSHDPFLRDVFVPLLAGGTVCIPASKEVILTSTKLAAWIKDSSISIIHCTPSLFRILNANVLTETDFKDLNYVLLAGEKIQPWSLINWFKVFGDRIQLVNLYGPTETTLAKLFYFIQPADSREKSIPIGKPISGCKAIILNKDMNICNIGEVGEIYLRTPYMSLGYYNNSELNGERFIQNPFTQTKDIIYKTGDTGMLRADGNIDFMGRKDRQIKIRGYRVELQEIENEINSYPGIRECVMNYHEKEDLHLKIQKDRCVICGMPSYYPGIELDSNGVCNKCKFFEDNKYRIDNYFGKEEELKTIFQATKDKKKSEYDCLLLYSGGKDSTYVLCKLVEYGLNVLAYTFDNGYISEVALNNIKHTLESLHVDYVIDSLPEMNKIFLDGLKEEVSVCNGCFKVLRAKSTILAYEKGIQYIVTGFSRGQLFDVRLDDIFKMDCFSREDIAQKIFEQRYLYHSKDDYVTKNLNRNYIVKKEMLEQVELIDFYRYTDVTKDEIMSYLKTNCPYWSNPKDTGMCSSNCLINDVGIYLQRKTYGYDNYTAPTSWELRLNHITKEAEESESESDIDTVKVKKILKELNYKEDFLPIDAEYSYITAYYLSDQEIDKEELRKYLEKKLPDYMVPSYFVPLNELPLTVNGKVDYAKLPNPKEILETHYVEPITDTEKEVERIFKNILGIKSISADAGFLKVGGNSLNIMALISQIYQAFNVEITLGQVFADSTIRGIARYIDQTKKSAVMQIVPVEKKDSYALSSAQTRLYLACQMDDDSSIVYNTPIVVEIRGKLDKLRLQDAFHTLIERHESLRTSFNLEDGRPVQMIHDSVNFTMDEITLPKEQELDNAIKTFVRPYKLTEAPLFRARLIKMDDEKQYLLMDIHHIISDGTSITILVNDLMALYDGKVLPQLKIQYKDFSEWQNVMLHSDALKSQEAYWMDKFAGSIPALNLPTDYERPAVQSYEGETLTIPVGAELTTKLKKLAVDTDSTEYHILMAALNVLLWKYSGQEDIIIGSPTAGRTNAELDDVIGVFINTIVLRNYPEGTKSFQVLLDEVKQDSVESLENQDYQFEKLVENLDIPRGLNHNPLFDVMMIYQNMDKPKLVNKELEFITHKYRNTISKYDFTVIVEIEQDNLDVVLEYCTKLYKRETAEIIMKNYIDILETVVNNPDIILRDIKLDSELSKLKKIVTDVEFDF